MVLKMAFTKCFRVLVAYLHITSNRFPPGGCHIRCNQAGAAILHGPAENVFSTKVGTLDSNAGG